MRVSSDGGSALLETACIFSELAASSSPKASAGMLQFYGAGGCGKNRDSFGSKVVLITRRSLVSSAWTSTTHGGRGPVSRQLRRQVML
jgi:hypothetical protein